MIEYNPMDPIDAIIVIKGRGSDIEEITAFEMSTDGRAGANMLFEHLVLELDPELAVDELTEYADIGSFFHSTTGKYVRIFCA